jgi:hypothetical protein
MADPKDNFEEYFLRIHYISHYTDGVSCVIITAAVIYTLLKLSFKLDTLAKITLLGYFLVSIFRVIDSFVFNNTLIVEMRNWGFLVLNLNVYYFVCVMKRVRDKFDCQEAKDYKVIKRRDRIIRYIVLALIIFNGVINTIRYVDIKTNSPGYVLPDSLRILTGIGGLIKLAIDIFMALLFVYLFIYILKKKQ